MPKFSFLLAIWFKYFFFRKFWSIDLTILSYKTRLWNNCFILLVYVEWSQTYGKLYYYRGIWMDSFLLCVLFFRSIPSGWLLEISCPKWWGSYHQGQGHIHRHTLVATYNHKQFIWGVLQEKLKGKEKAWLAVRFSVAQMSRKTISSPPEMQRLNEIYGKWHVPRTYHTESWAVQALVGITITVTGQTFFRVGKEESSVAFLKQTQQKHLHDWKGPFWVTLSGRSKRWLVNDLHISLQHTYWNELFMLPFNCLCYISFFPLFPLCGFRVLQGRAPDAAGAPRGQMAPKSRDVQLPARTVTSSALRELLTLSEDNRNTFNTVQRC